MSAKQYKDLVGLRNLVFAEGVKDDGSTFEAGFWNELEGAVSGDVAYEESNEARYRDNRVIDGTFTEGPDTATFMMDILANKVRAKLEGRTYSATNDVLIKTPKKKNQWFVVGGIKTFSDGSESAFIMYKTTVTAGNDTYETKANSVTYQTKDYVFTGVYTNTKIATDEDGNKTFAKSVEVPLSDKVTEAKLFGTFEDGISEVKPLTPDAIVALA